ncbi:MAG: hypothetical protein VXW87_02230 [Pseudomonadota bacterium]|nr:hypothetical protein [Pseudomonadota bacterium]
MKNITNHPMTTSATATAAKLLSTPCSQRKNEPKLSLSDEDRHLLYELVEPSAQKQKMDSTKGSTWLNSLYEIFPGGYQEAREIIKKMSRSTKKAKSSLNWESHIGRLCKLIDLLSYENQCDIYQVLFESLSNKGFKLKVNPMYKNKFSDIFKVQSGDTTDKTPKQLQVEADRQSKLQDLKKQIKKETRLEIEECDWSVLDVISIPDLLEVFKYMVSDVKTDFAIAISNHPDYAGLVEELLDKSQTNSLKFVKKAILGRIEFTVIETNRVSSDIKRVDSDPGEHSYEDPLCQADDLMRSESETGPSSLLVETPFFGKSFVSADSQSVSESMLDTAWLEIKVSNEKKKAQSLLQIYMQTRVLYPDVEKALTEILVDKVLKYNLQGTSSNIFPVSKTIEDITLFLWASEMKLPKVIGEEKLKLYRLLNPRLTCFAVNNTYIKSYINANIKTGHAQRSHIFDMFAASQAYIEGVEKSKPSPYIRDWKLTCAKDSNGPHYMLTHQDAHISVDKDNNLTSRLLSLGLHWTTWDRWQSQVINMCAHISMDWGLKLNSIDGKVEDGGVLKLHDFNFGYSLESHLANPSAALRLPSYNAPELVEQPFMDNQVALHNYLHFITVSTKDSKNRSSQIELLAKLQYIAKGYHRRALERLQSAAWLATYKDVNWTQMVVNIDKMKKQTLPLQGLALNYLSRLETSTNVHSMTILTPDNQPQASWVRRGNSFR